MFLSFTTRAIILLSIHASTPNILFLFVSIALPTLGNIIVFLGKIFAFIFSFISFKFK